MIFARITQNGTRLTLEKYEAYKHSQNLMFEFIKDPIFEDYVVEGFARLNSKDIRLEISEENTFKLDEKYFTNDMRIALSFALIKDDEIIHLGIVSFRVSKAFGNLATPLDEHPDSWKVIVEKKVDDYFNENYKQQLDDFNTKKESIDSKYQEVMQANESVSKTLNSVNEIANQIVQDKNEINKQVENFKNEVDNFNQEYDEKVNNFNQDYTQKVANFDKLDINSKKEITDLTNSSKEAINNLSDSSKKEISNLNESSKQEINNLKNSSKKELSAQESEILNNLKQQYSQFDSLINRLDELGLTVVENQICVEGE